MIYMNAVVNLNVELFVFFSKKSHVGLTSPFMFTGCEKFLLKNKDRPLKTFNENDLCPHKNLCIWMEHVVPKHHVDVHQHF